MLLWLLMMVSLVFSWWFGSWIWLLFGVCVRGCCCSFMVVIWLSVMFMLIVVCFFLMLLICCWSRVSVSWYCVCC